MFKKSFLTISIIFFFIFSNSPLVMASSRNQRKSPQKVTISKKVNINTATLSELCSLKGIGEKIAQRIVNFRKKNGKFKKIEEIKAVKGIGEKKFEKIKNSICVK